MGTPEAAPSFNSCGAVEKEISWSLVCLNCFPNKWTKRILLVVAMIIDIGVKSLLWSRDVSACGRSRRSITNSIDKPTCDKANSDSSLQFSRMLIQSSNNVKIYNLSAGKSLPEVRILFCPYIVFKCLWETNCNRQLTF